MSYNKHTWVNNVDAVDEDKMNHIENGIKDLDQGLSEVFNAKPNADWRLKSGVYHYEGADTTALDLPFAHVQVLTLRKGGNRGVALAMRWADNEYYLWMNRLHDDTAQNQWAGWVQVYAGKDEIAYQSWHSVVLTRSDNNLLYIMLYGSNHLKEGTYSIDIEGGDSFELRAYGSTNGNLIIPKTALNSISRRDWGFELTFNRSNISGMSGEYNGVGIIHEHTLRLKST